MTGYSKKEALEKTAGFLQGPKTSKKKKAEIEFKLKENRPFKTTLINYRKNKSIILPTLKQKNKSINVMIVYTLPSILSYSEIEDKISVTLQRLADEV